MGLLSDEGAFKDGEHIIGAKNYEVLAINGDFCTAVFAIENDVADLDFHRSERTIILSLAGANRECFALQGLFLSSIGKENTTGRSGLFGGGFHDYSIMQRREFHCVGSIPPGVLIRLVFGVQVSVFGFTDSYFAARVTSSLHTDHQAPNTAHRFIIDSMPWIEPVALEGSTIRLIPAELAHAEELHGACPSDTFAYFVTLQPEDESLDAFRNYLSKRVQAPNMVSFVVQDIETERLIGETAFMDIRPEARGLEIGLTWYAKDCRGTQINPECKLLLLSHAFEDCDALRVTLKTDARNLHSQAAIRKLGAQYEGTLRRHGIQPNGFIRDTAYFGITDLDWPAAKAKIQSRLQSL